MSDFTGFPGDPDDPFDPENEPVETSDDDAPEDIEDRPIQLGSVEISPGVFAVIYAEPGAIFDPVEANFSDLYELLGVEPDSVIPGPIPSDFNPDDPNIRGPFHDLTSLRNFMRETGLGDFGEAFFDAENDEFFFEIGDTP